MQVLAQPTGHPYFRKPSGFLHFSEFKPKIFRRKIPPTGHWTGAREVFKGVKKRVLKQKDLNI